MLPDVLAQRQATVVDAGSLVAADIAEMPRLRVVASLARLVTRVAHDPAVLPGVGFHPLACRRVSEFLRHDSRSGRGAKIDRDAQLVLRVTGPRNAVLGLVQPVALDLALEGARLCRVAAVGGNDAQWAAGLARRAGHRRQIRNDKIAHLAAALESGS